MKKKMILIADDTADLLNNMVEALELEDYAVIETKNGAEALKELEESNPDLIITDLLMIKVDGFELIKRVRDDVRWRRIPILVHSALAERDVVEKAMTLGATAFITKPCSIEAFLDAVASVIKQPKI